MEDGTFGEPNLKWQLGYEASPVCSRTLRLALPKSGSKVAVREAQCSPCLP